MHGFGPHACIAQRTLQVLCAHASAGHQLPQEGVRADDAAPAEEEAVRGLAPLHYVPLWQGPVLCLRSE